MMKYDSYKDSEIDWLGNIPEHWSNHRVDWISTLIRGNTGFKKDELLNNGEYVALQYGKTYKVDEVNNTFKYFVNSEFYKNGQIVRRGDTIIISTSETIEDLGHSCFYNRDDLGLIGGEQILLKPNRKLVIGKYLYYYSKKFCTELQKYPTGLKVFRFNIDDLKRIFLAIPSLPEQTAIANYLDIKTQAIDKKVSLLEKKIGYYLELRKSLINETVTIGFDKNVKLKNSGIDWIGRIPEHWGVIRAKAVFKEINLKSLTGSGDLLSVSEYYGIAKKSDIMGDEDYVSRAETLEGYKLCRKGDLVINIMLAWKRGLGVSEYDGLISPSYAVYRLISRHACPQYFHYLLRTDQYIAEFKKNSTGIIDSRLRIYSDKFYNISILLPPQSEQEEIAYYLDKKTSQLDQIIANVKSQITILKELRKTLINDVVTGKIKVINDEEEIEESIKEADQIAIK